MSILEDQEVGQPAGKMLFQDTILLAQLVRTQHVVSPGMGPLAMPEQQLMYLAPEGTCGTIRCWGWPLVSWQGREEPLLSLGLPLSNW